MAIDKATVTNIDNSDPTNYPNARIKDDDGAGNGTPVNRKVYSDIHEFFAKLMRQAAITYNELPDSTTNGYQLVDAAIALAGKNDFITPLNTVNMLVSGVATDVLTVPLVFSTLKLNEALICKAAIDKTTQTLIKGSEAALLTVTFTGSFKAGDYIRFIKTSAGVTLVRLADAGNLDVLAGELLYLKAASDAEDIAGTLTTKATTPHSNKAAFTQRVTGADSGTYLASASHNGLLSAAQWSLLAALPVNPVKNVGWASGIDVGGSTVGTDLPVNPDGDITQCQVIFVAGDGGSGQWECTMANAMADSNYYVRMMIESQSTFTVDTNILPPVFKPISTTKFQFSMDQSSGGGVQSLKIHFEVVQIG